MMLPLVGCFSPDGEITPSTDGNDGPGSSSGAAMETVSPGTGSASGMSSADASTSASTTAGPVTGDPTSDTDTTTSPDTFGETEAPACEGPGDCDAGVCVEGACVPCTDADDPDAACAARNADTPSCGDDGLCVACTPSSCGGNTPACDPTAGCVACTEHSQCPDSACHLGGPDQGSCFDVNDVVEVSDTSELVDEMANLTSGTTLAIHLLPGNYQEMPTVFVPEGAEVAWIGAPDTTLSGGFTNLLAQGSGSLLYVYQVNFENGPGRALRVGDAWVDRVSVEGFTAALVVDFGETRVRRSKFRGTSEDGGLVQVFETGSLVATNTDFGPQGNPALSTSGPIDLRYVTIAGNEGGLECQAGASGSIRNSILVNPGSTNAGGCRSLLDFVDTATDTTGFGENIGPFDAGWFVVSDESRFLLSASGQSIFEGIADWDEGDPLFDIEGDPRPTEALGYPGVDEP
ncbi:MAG: hypothetical protein AAGA54_33545 [Myxococcota bacterium]